MAGEFGALEARLWAVLAPYRDRLEEGSVYGLVTLKRPGANAHQFFAGVRVAAKHVSFPPDADLRRPRPARRRVAGASRSV